MTLRPLGPSVTLTARASLPMPRFMASRASWSNAICLALIRIPRVECSVSGGLCLAASRRRACRRSPRTQSTSPSCIRRMSSAAAARSLNSSPAQEVNSTLSPTLSCMSARVPSGFMPARADGQDRALLRLVLGGVRQQDAAGRLLFGGFAADDDTVADRFQAHDGSSGAGNRVGRPSHASTVPARRVSAKCLWESELRRDRCEAKVFALPGLRGGCEEGLSLWQGAGRRLTVRRVRSATRADRCGRSRRRTIPLSSGRTEPSPTPVGSWPRR